MRLRLVMATSQCISVQLQFPVLGETSLFVRPSIHPSI